MKLSASDRKRLTRKLSAMTDRKPVEQAVREVGEDLLSKSVDLAPKDIGDLRASGNVRHGNVQGSPFARVGFDEPYALVQHERLDFEHTDGEAKYLESPYLANRKRYTEHIKNAARSSR